MTRYSLFALTFFVGAFYYAALPWKISFLSVELKLKFNAK
ncbi:hypothetical protein HMPREF1982_04715 [Clostridiales bacterium oral taxon 876 str. F0540]|nr:hypothetical protein HMPREF1982_04715 [Clostridiales bacterium oral taxon 876 str. F0540]